MIDTNELKQKVKKKATELGVKILIWAVIIIVAIIILRSVI
jgi:hypothetical protein